MPARPASTMMKMNEVHRQTSRRIAPAMPPKAVDIQGTWMPRAASGTAINPPWIGEERDAEIADRHFEGEQRRADDGAERARAGRAEIDQPRGEKAEHEFDRHGDDDIDRP